MENHGDPRILLEFEITPGNRRFHIKSLQDGYIMVEFDNNFWVGRNSDRVSLNGGVFIQTFTIIFNHYLTLSQKAEIRWKSAGVVSKCLLENTGNLLKNLFSCICRHPSHGKPWKGLSMFFGIWKIYILKNVHENIYLKMCMHNNWASDSVQLHRVFVRC